MFLNKEKNILSVLIQAQHPLLDLLQNPQLPLTLRRKRGLCVYLQTWTICLPDAYSKIFLPFLRQPFFDCLAGV